jgi:hypothetical protein
VKFERGLRERICVARLDGKAGYCVRLANMDTGYREITTYTSTHFDALAKRFNLAPDYLAFLLLEHFAIIRLTAFCSCLAIILTQRQDGEPLR